MCTGMPHRHSIFCIVPPHILHEIARNGTTQERDLALGTLATDGTLRTRRVTHQLLAATSYRNLLSTAPVAKVRSIYDAGQTPTLPGQPVRAEGQPATGDPAADEAYDGLGATFDFYWQVYQRNSIDNQGMHLDATVHYSEDGSGYDNAFWNGQQMVFGDGDGIIFNRFTIALDVIGHELTHGVTGSEVNLIYTGESGALNESISDVFGSLVKQYALQQDANAADWLIGAGLLKIEGAALRSMKAPGTAYDDPKLGKDPQPATMSQFVHTSRDNGGVHINSGIPNHAFFLLATQLGGNAWGDAGRLWYETIRDSQLNATASFQEFAQRTAINAGNLFGISSPQKQAVVNAWDQVEIQVL
jgi:Zn-dependent metalloprotease